MRERVRWPIVEAMGTAYALYTVTGEAQYEAWYQKWWDYCIKYLMDYENGSWWQELDTNNEVTTKVWDGKQDIYHLLPGDPPPAAGSGLSPCRSRRITG